MSTNRGKALVSDISSDIETYWNEFKLPFPATLIQSRYAWRIKTIYGKGSGFGWIVEEMSRHGIIKRLLSISHKRWVLPIQAWNSLSVGEREKLQEWVNDALDPSASKGYKTREANRIKIERAAHNIDTEENY